MWQIHGLTLTASLVVQLIGLLIPLVVAWLAHQNAPSWFKGGLNAALGAVEGSVGVLVAANGGYDWRSFIQAILSALSASVISYIVVTKHIGGPQLEQAGLTLGRSLVTTISEDAMNHIGKHEAPLPTDQTPATGNVRTMPKGDGGYTPIYTIAYLLILLGVAGLILGLVGRHVADLASCAWMLIPGIILLVVGVIMAILFGPVGPWRRYGPGRPPV